MNIFPCTKLPVYLSIVCCSLTLALAVVQLVSSTASHLLPTVGAGQQGGSQLYLLHDLTLSGMVAEEQGVAKTQEYIKYMDKQPPQYSSRFSVRKLASLFVHNVGVPRHHNQQYDDKPHSFSGKTAGRKLLLHSADDHHEMSTTTATITANGAAKTSGNPARDPHHDVDESSAFHVDYSGPKTHPPKNN